MKSAMIIGAGPAGSTAAIMLARRGWDVTIIEQHRFPRDKVCGECISALGMDVLRRLGASLPQAIPLKYTTLATMDGREVTISLPRAMCALSRKRLDAMMLDMARDAGVRVLQLYRFEGTRIRDLMTNRMHEVSADVVLIADGKPRSQTEDLGVKAHFADVHAADDTISLFGLHGHYVGLAPIEDGHWNVAMSVPAKIVRKFHGNLQGMWEDLLTQNTSLRNRFRDARRVSDWLASPLPRFAPSRNWPANTIPLGNAAAAIEPIGGEGIGLAMRSAELAAIALDENRSVAELQRDFRRLWRTRRFMCRAAAIALSSPPLANLMIRTLQAHKNLGALSISWMKPTEPSSPPAEAEFEPA